MPLAGGLAIPEHGLHIVLRHAWPLKYIQPRAACASAFPSSANGRQSRNAVSLSLLR
jgi:hypothetical protein